MDERAQTLENNRNEWREHMGLQAAAIFYDLDIEVAIKIRTKQVYVDQVHSYNRNGRQLKNAKKCIDLYTLTEGVISRLHRKSRL